MSNYTYTGSKGEYTVWEQAGNTTTVYGTMRKSMDVNKWRIFPSGFGSSYSAEGKTRDVAIDALTELQKTLASVVPSVLVIDGAMALQSLKDAVALRGGNFVYQEDGFKQGVAPAYNQRCMYEWRGQASCGVGVALSTLGVPISALTLMDANSDGVGTQISTVNIPGVTLTDRARIIYSAFQIAQDGGRRWSYALDVAERAAGVVG